MSFSLILMRNNSIVLINDSLKSIVSFITYYYEKQTLINVQLIIAILITF